MARSVCLAMREDILRIRNLILQEPVALDKWPRVIDDFIVSPSDVINLKTLFSAGDHPGSILGTLRIFYSVGGLLVQLDQTLRDLGLIALADAINGENHSGLLFDVGFNALNFQGRTKELEQLHRMMSASQSTGRYAPILITGLGGIGKTSLARKYAYTYKQDCNSNVIWINAETFDTAKESIIALAEKMGAQVDAGRTESCTEIAAKVFAKLNVRPVLFIFDNVEEKEHFNQFKPPVRSFDKVFVLLTSRRTDLVSLPEHKLKLGVLSQNDAVGLIRRQLENVPQRDAEDLANTLQQLPLALQQALAYIRNTDLGDANCVGRYLEEYGRSAQALLADGQFQDEEEETYSHTVLTTWRVTFNKIAKTNEDAVEVMLALSFLKWTDTPKSFLEKKLGDITGSLKVLEKYSMVEIFSRKSDTFILRLGTREPSTVISVHRLVKRVIRMTLSCREQIMLAEKMIKYHINLGIGMKLFLGGAAAVQCLCCSIILGPIGGIVVGGVFSHIILMASKEENAQGQMRQIVKMLKEAHEYYDQSKLLEANDVLKRVPKRPAPTYEEECALEGGTLENIFRALNLKVTLKLEAVL